MNLFESLIKTRLFVQNMQLLSANANINQNIFMAKNGKLTHFHQIRDYRTINLDSDKFQVFNNAKTYINSQYAEVTNKVIDVTGLKYLTKSTIIRNCVFTHINGAGVFTDSQLLIKNCKFDNINSEMGAIIAKEDLVMKYTLFNKCNGIRESSAFYQNTTESSLKINFTTLNRCNSDLFGAFQKRGIIGSNVIENTNISDNFASSCVGAFEIEGGSIALKTCLLNHNGANVHNGCAVFRNLESLQIQMCIFTENYHKSSENLAAAAILSFDTPSYSVLSDSIFKNNRRDKSYTVRFANGKDTYITNCCFTGNKSREICIESTPIFRNTTFETCKIRTDHKSLNKIGYRKINVFQSQVSLGKGVLLFIKCMLIPIIAYITVIIIIQKLGKIKVKTPKPSKMQR